MKRWNRLGWGGLLALALAAPVLGQRQVPVLGDSIPVFTFEPVVIATGVSSEKQARALARQQEKVDRLRYNVYRTYPIAVEAAVVVSRIERELAAKGGKRDQREYVNRLEKELFAQYESRLRKLSITQGRILIKLIDRQTGQSAFRLIKDLKSGRTAFMWQVVARLFGSNLKWEYNPEEEYQIEQIVQAIESGEDTVYPLYARWFAQRDAQRQ